MGNFDWKGWGKLIMTIIGMAIAFTLFLGGLLGDIETVAKSALINTTWIQKHIDDTAEFQKESYATRGTVLVIDSKMDAMKDEIQELNRDIKTILREMQK